MYNNKYRWDTATDIGVMVNWYQNGVFKLDVLFNVDSEETNTAWYALGTTFCILLYKVVSSYGIWIQMGWKTAVLQFLDVLVYKEVLQSLYNSKRANTKALKTTVHYRWIRKTESIFESAPQSVFQFIFLLKTGELTVLLFSSVLLSLYSVASAIVQDDEWKFLQDSNWNKKMPPHRKFLFRYLFRVLEITARLSAIAVFWLFTIGWAVTPYVVANFVFYLFLKKAKLLGHELANVFGAFILYPNLSIRVNIKLRDINPIGLIIGFINFWTPVSYILSKQTCFTVDCIDAFYIARALENMAFLALSLARIQYLEFVERFDITMIIVSFVTTIAYTFMYFVVLRKSLTKVDQNLDFDIFGFMSSANNGDVFKFLNYMQRAPKSVNTKKRIPYAPPEIVKYNPSFEIEIEISPIIHAIRIKNLYLITVLLKPKLVLPESKARKSKIDIYIKDNMYQRNVLIWLIIERNKILNDETKTKEQIRKDTMDTQVIIMSILEYSYENPGPPVYGWKDYPYKKRSNNKLYEYKSTDTEGGLDLIIAESPSVHENRKDDKKDTSNNNNDEIKKQKTMTNLDEIMNIKQALNAKPKKSKTKKTRSLSNMLGSFNIKTVLGNRNSLKNFSSQLKSLDKVSFDRVEHDFTTPMKTLQRHRSKSVDELQSSTASDATPVDSTPVGNANKNGTKKSYKKLNTANKNGSKKKNTKKTTKKKKKKRTASDVSDIRNNDSPIPLKLKLKIVGSQSGGSSSTLSEGSSTSAHSTPSKIEMDGNADKQFPNLGFSMSSVKSKATPTALDAPVSSALAGIVQNTVQTYVVERKGLWNGMESQMKLLNDQDLFGL